MLNSNHWRGLINTHPEHLFDNIKIQIIFNISLFESFGCYQFKKISDLPSINFQNLYHHRGALAIETQISPLLIFIILRDYPSPPPCSFGTYLWFKVAESLLLIRTVTLVTQDQMKMSCNWHKYYSSLRDEPLWLKCKTKRSLLNEPV